MKPFAEVDLNDAPDYYGGYKAPWVLRWHAISRAASDRVGQIQHASAGAHLTDIPRYFRGRLAEEATRYLTNKPVVLRMIDDEERRHEGLPRVVANGYVSDYAPDPDLQFDLTLTDWLRKKFSRKRQAQQSWQPLITTTDFPFCPPETVGTPVPIVLGAMSDQDLQTTEVGSAFPYDPALPLVTSVMAADIDGGGTLNGNISIIVTYLDGSGNESGPSNISRTYDFNRGVKALWNGVSGAASYRIYFHDGQFWESWNPQTGVRTDIGAPPTFVRVLTHDTTPGDGDWAGIPLREFGVTLTSAMDGADALSGVTTATVDHGHGLVKPIYCGIEEVAFSGNYYHVGLVSLGTMASIDELYVDGVAQNIATDPTQTGIGGIWLIPGYEGWNNRFGTGSPPDAPLYEDRGGAARRYTVIYGKVGYAGPDRMAGVLGNAVVSTGSSPLLRLGVTLSVQGIERNGDGTGDVLTRGLEQALWFVTNLIAPDTPYQTGIYLTADGTTFPHIPDLPLVDAQSFADADAATEARLGGSPSLRYEGAGIIGANGEFSSALDVLARFAASYDFDWTWNHRWQLGASLEPIAPVSTTDSLDDVHNIQAQSFRILDQVTTDFFNIHPYVHTRDYVGTTESGWSGKDEARDTDSIANYDQERESPQWELHFGRTETPAGAATIADVMQRKRARFRHPRRLATFRVPLSGVTKELCETITITHAEGIGAAGWLDHQVRIVRHDTDPNDNTVVLGCYDLETVFE